ncbi:MAG: hypothetical protein R3198_11560, partial [Marinobacter sp.]|nr:hypothetical protein [Marinobacter sp.]
MMLLTHVVPTSTTLTNAGCRQARTARGRLSPRARRCVEGISLWLAVLLFLFVHPVFAEAS